MLDDLRNLRALDKEMIIPDDLREKTHLDMRNSKSVHRSICRVCCIHVSTYQLSRCYTLKPAIKVIEIYGPEASTIGVLLLDGHGPVVVSLIQIIGDARSCCQLYLRLHGGLYVSGVCEEKELAVRALLGDEIDFKALGQSDIMFVCILDQSVRPQN